MRTSRQRGDRLRALLCLVVPVVLACTVILLDAQVVNAQDGIAQGTDVRPELQQSDIVNRSEVTRQRETPAETVDAEVSGYELAWQAIETHGKVVLHIGGTEISIRKEFGPGEEPFLNAFEEGLTAGVYDYRVEFVPNELQSDRDRLVDLMQRRKALFQEREYAAARELAREAEGLMSNSQQQDAYEFIFSTGQIIVAEDGSIERFDVEKILQQQADHEREQKQLNPPAREDDAGDERRDF